MLGIALTFLRQHDADSDRARRLLPLGDDVINCRIVRIDRLDDGHPVRMGARHLDRVARVILVHGKSRDEDRAVDADLVHRRYHLVTRDVIGPVRHIVPGPLRRVGLVGMDLGIDNRHPDAPRYFERVLTLPERCVQSAKADALCRDGACEYLAGAKPTPFSWAREVEAPAPTAIRSSYFQNR